MELSGTKLSLAVLYLFVIKMKSLDGWRKNSSFSLEFPSEDPFNFLLLFPPPSKPVPNS